MATWVEMKNGGHINLDACLEFCGSFATRGDGERVLLSEEHWAPPLTPTFLPAAPGTVAVLLTAHGGAGDLTVEETEVAVLGWAAHHADGSVWAEPVTLVPPESHERLLAPDCRGHWADRYERHASLDEAKEAFKAMQEARLAREARQAQRRRAGTASGAG